MSFFRSKEIRRFSTILLILFAAALGAGFLISKATGIFTLVLGGVFGGAFFIFTKKRYNNIAYLGEQIDLVLHGTDTLDIDVCQEGELSILQSEIHKMTVRLREQAGRLKKDKIYLADSLADIAHQLRTPLTSIRIIVSFLGQNDLDPEKRAELARDLETLLSRIDWLITALLKISKIEAGTATFQKAPLLVPETLEKALSPLAIPLEIKEIRLDMDGDRQAGFVGDLNWTAEAIGNVLKNCLDHTEKGGHIGITWAENAVFTEIMIKDNGRGIDPEDLPHIFERFYQGKNAGGNSFGVGLALCRMILAAQNGTIKATNTPSGGACFSLRFYHQVV